MLAHCYLCIRARRGPRGNGLAFGYRLPKEAGQTHVSMLCTVILGRVEWKDLAKVSRVDVEIGRLDRIAVLTTGRRNCLVAEYIDVAKKGREEETWLVGGTRVLLYRTAYSSSTLQLSSY